MNYIIPDYYEYFQCKCSECRHSCCDGWPIRISQKEYYRLLGMDCSPGLRRKLDSALKICLEPRIDSFAQITTNWLGKCMLHREDGLCALQAELGESFLPGVCRLYPRNTRHLPSAHQCSCSNSCEAVVELLMNRIEPMTFKECDLPITPEFEHKLSPQKYESCRNAISLIQNRSLSLRERLITLGNYLFCNDLFSQKTEQPYQAFRLLKVFLQYYETSDSVADYCRSTQSFFALERKEELTDEDLAEIAIKYNMAARQLDSLMPDWQLLLEQLLVNHMFHHNFPYTDQLEKATDAFVSLTVMYSFVRFNLLGLLSDKPGMDDLVDFFAAMFRLIDHSNFYYVSANIFKREKHLFEECIPQLLSI